MRGGQEFSRPGVIVRVVSSVSYDVQIGNLVSHISADKLRTTDPRAVPIDSEVLPERHGASSSAAEVAPHWGASRAVPSTRGHRDCEHSVGVQSQGLSMHSGGEESASDSFVAGDPVATSTPHVSRETPDRSSSFSDPGASSPLCPAPVAREASEISSHGEQAVPETPARRSLRENRRPPIRFRD